MISYTLEQVQEGFVSRCIANKKATAFGKTKEQAGNNLVKAIQEYLTIYPEKDEEFNTLYKEIKIN